MDFLNFVEDLDFYIDNRKCEYDEFLDRVKILPKEDNSDILKSSIVDDILEMIEYCRTEDDLKEDLLDYFNDIRIEIVE